MAKTPAITQEMLPEGWILGTPYVGLEILDAPFHRGSISIDLAQRSFAIGTGTRAMARTRMVYTGRGWLEQLLAEAIHEFDAAFEK